MVENGRAIGLLPFRCVAEIPRTEWDVKRVRDCMLGLDRVQVFAPDDDALDAFAALSQDELHRGLVLAGDRLVGLLSITDLATALEAPPRRPRPTPTVGHDAAELVHPILVAPHCSRLAGTRLPPPLQLAMLA